MSSPNSDINLYLSATFRDPYLHPLYLRTNDPQSIYQQTMGDWLLDTFIHKLNGDICDDLELDQMTHNILKQILTYTRIFGYCVICNYENGDGIRVYSEVERVDWIRLNNSENKRVERAGIKVNWSDDLGNSYNDDVYFIKDDQSILYQNNIDPNSSFGYLLIYDKGSGRILPNCPSSSAFAIGELTPALLGMAIQARQALNTMSFGASHPYFYHLKYGDSIDAKQIQRIENIFRNVSVSNGFGAKKSIVDEIVPVENSSVEKSILALDQLVSYFSGITRLPLSYYLGERSNGGLGDTGEQADNVDIIMRKREILSHLATDINIIFSQIGLQQIKIDLYSLKLDEITQQEKAQKEQNNFNNNSD